MVPTAQPTSSQLIPPSLKSSLPHPHTPWNFSESLFKRVQNYTSDKSFKLCEVLNTDPELNFILKYFEHQKPPGYSIKRVVCIHNPEHTGLFELSLKNMEREASNPVFAPKGKDEEPKADRARVLVRWEAQASQFSPVEIKSFSSRGTDTCTKVKVLPLWHGSTKEVCQSICWSGFTSFGKHHYFDENASKGNTKSTDKGYFGAGIYFTNSAHYATMYSSAGHLLLSWVSMREPYPVVNDKPHPQKGSDMVKLEGRMHYQNYNAHFIPVASIRPSDPKCIEYYPCYKDQSSSWDELVVFHTSQALPRFWVELGIDFPNVALSSSGTAGELLTLLLSLLDKPEVQNHAALSQMLQTKADLMLDQGETSPLGAEDQRFLKLAKRILPEGEKLSNGTVNMLLKMGTASPPIPPAAAPVKASPPPLSVASLAPTLPKALPLNPAEPKKEPDNSGINIFQPSASLISPPIHESPSVKSNASRVQELDKKREEVEKRRAQLQADKMALHGLSQPPVPSQETPPLPTKSKPSQTEIGYTAPPSAATLAPAVPHSSVTTIAFGKKLWAEYLGDVGEEPPLPPNIHQILQSPCPFIPGQRVEETHLLTLIPKTVNEKPLTLNFLEELVKYPKKGYATNYQRYWDRIKNEYGTQPPQRSYWVLMTKCVIPGSFGKSYDTQVQLLKEKSQKAQVVYEMPKLLEAATSILMEYLRTGKPLYSDSPWTFTRCQERVSIDPSWPLVVGGFAAGGLSVGYYNFNENVGVGGLRRNFSVDTLPPIVPADSLAKQSQKPLPPPPIAKSKIIQPEIVLKASPSTPSAASLAPALPAIPAPVSVKVPTFSQASIKLILPTIAFGKEKWAKYIGDVGEEPALPPDIEKILNSPCPFFPGNRVEETHLLMLIPKTVNGKPLTLNFLEELVQHPKQGQATRFRDPHPKIIMQDYGIISIPQSYWIILTKDVIPGSRDKTYQEQVEILQQYSQKAGVKYEVPRLLETTATLFVQYIANGRRYYGDEPGTFTSCQDIIYAHFGRNPLVGCFDNNGLIISYGGKGISVGVGGSRRFT